MRPCRVTTTSRERGFDDVVEYCTHESICFVPFYPLRAEHPAAAEIASAHGATQAQIALAWLLHRSPQILPIPGSLSAEHVRQNVAALDIELTPDEVEALSKK